MSLEMDLVANLTAASDLLLPSRASLLMSDDSLLRLLRETFAAGLEGVVSDAATDVVTVESVVPGIGGASRRLQQQQQQQQQQQRPRALAASSSVQAFLLEVGFAVAIHSTSGNVSEVEEQASDIIEVIGNEDFVRRLTSTFHKNSSTVDLAAFDYFKDIGTTSADVNSLTLSTPTLHWVTSTTESGTSGPVPTTTTTAAASTSTQASGTTTVPLVAGGFLVIGDFAPICLVLLAGLVAAPAFAALSEQSSNPFRPLCNCLGGPLAALRAQGSADGMPNLANSSWCRSRLPTHLARWRSTQAGASSTWEVHQAAGAIKLKPLESNSRFGEVSTVLTHCGWGEFKTSRGLIRVRYLAPSRLIVTVSNSELQKSALQDAGLKERSGSDIGIARSGSSSKMTGPTDSLTVASMVAECAQRSNSVTKGGRSELELAIDLSPVTHAVLLFYVVAEVCLAVLCSAASWWFAGACLGIGAVITLATSQLRRVQMLAPGGSLLRIVAVVAPTMFCTIALLCSRDGGATGKWLPSALGLTSTIAAVFGLFYESDNLGFVLLHFIDTLTGIGAVTIAVLDFVQTPSLGQVASFDELTSARLTELSRVVALLRLASLAFGRLMASMALHPYAQPLRAPKKHEVLNLREMVETSLSEVLAQKFVDSPVADRPDEIKPPTLLRSESRTQNLRPDRSRSLPEMSGGVSLAQRELPSESSEQARITSRDLASDRSIPPQLDLEAGLPDVRPAASALQPDPMMGKKSDSSQTSKGSAAAGSSTSAKSRNAAALKRMAGRRRKDWHDTENATSISPDRVGSAKPSASKQNDAAEISELLTRLRQQCAAQPRSADQKATRTTEEIATAKLDEAVAAATADGDEGNAGEAALDAIAAALRIATQGDDSPTATLLRALRIATSKQPLRATAGEASGAAFQPKVPHPKKGPRSMRRRRSSSSSSSSSGIVGDGGDGRVGGEAQASSSTGGEAGLSSTPSASDAASAATTLLATATAKPPPDALPADAVASRGASPSRFSVIVEEEAAEAETAADEEEEDEVAGSAERRGEAEQEEARSGSGSDPSSGAAALPEEQNAPQHRQPEEQMASETTAQFFRMDDNDSEAGGTSHIGEVRDSDFGLSDRQFFLRLAQLQPEIDSEEEGLHDASPTHGQSPVARGIRRQLLFSPTSPSTSSSPMLPPAAGDAEVEPPPSPQGQMRTLGVPCSRDRTPAARPLSPIPASSANSTPPRTSPAQTPLEVLSPMARHSPTFEQPEQVALDDPESAPQSARDSDFGVSDHQLVGLADQVATGQSLHDTNEEEGQDEIVEANRDPPEDELADKEGRPGSGPPPEEAQQEHHIVEEEGGAAASSIPPSLQPTLELLKQNQHHQAQREEHRQGHRGRRSSHHRQQGGSGRSLGRTDSKGSREGANVEGEVHEADGGDDDGSSSSISGFSSPTLSMSSCSLLTGSFLGSRRASTEADVDALVGRASSHSSNWAQGLASGLPRTSAASLGALPSSSSSVGPASNAAQVSATASATASASASAVTPASSLSFAPRQRIVAPTAYIPQGWRVPWPGAAAAPGPAMATIPSLNIAPAQSAGATFQPMTSMTAGAAAAAAGSPRTGAAGGISVGASSAGSLEMEGTFSGLSSSSAGAGGGRGAHFQDSYYSLPTTLLSPSGQSGHVDAWRTPQEPLAALLPTEPIATASPAQEFAPTLSGDSHLSRSSKISQRSAVSTQAILQEELRHQRRLHHDTRELLQQQAGLQEDLQGLHLQQQQQQQQQPEQQQPEQEALAADQELDRASDVPRADTFPGGK